jgi:anti-sigma factor ChrR (cupin superfamily)
VKTTMLAMFGAAAMAAAALIGPAAAAEGGKAKAKPQAQDKVVPASETTWQPMDPKNPDGPQFATLWGKPDKAPHGFFLKVKAGVMFPRHSHTYAYDAVVVQGDWKHIYGNEADSAPLPPGSHWHQPGKQVHADGCASTTGECIVLVSFPAGKRDFIPAPEAKKPM